ncbi:TonB-dependent receptor [Psychrobium sp. 1_MG-2023]|uniref:TonB-dependent receptor n=1 Tax=Psychrobium sp. 1_MG-2023 TaxID=3062624 RepID=UPI000C33BD84|nr:TonB-dependent receptor [Psychrobium sp. 1_MG-2023]MDP2559580.1 TonB-dependent receptor [Psychrobium sp. 1_MG-2023]PKF59415.1 TonB-dependent receptor [Alteromonadales bacterium alter-6D02]
MRKLSPIMSALLAISASGHLYAEQVQGTVTNTQGAAVVGATVKVVGTNNVVKTNENGVFNLDVKPGSYELHVVADRFVHENVDVNVIENQTAQVSVSLDKSAIEIIDVSATPFHSSNIESALPITVLQGESLRMRQENTLGDTLSKEIGVHSNFHGSVASTPIIRGLDGPRVLITQNGLDAGDASRVGPDHAVSTEASTTERIEVLRGPATLFYGSGAIGGVVNLVDERIPRDRDTKGEWLAEHNSNNDQKLFSGSFNTSVGDVALHADGFYRDNENYHAPKKDGKDEIANSASESTGFTLGSSYLLDNGFVGVSYQALDQEYGIPGHSHGDEEIAVLADMEQKRWQLLSELDFENSVIKTLNTKVAYTDYRHSELEVGVVGTTFDNESLEARVELLHQDYAGWRGGVSLHYKESDFIAVGAEAFTPPSETSSIALAWIEERHFDDVLLQLGARVERTKITAAKVRLPEIELFEDHDEHDHDEHADEAHGHHEHGHDEHDHDEHAHHDQEGMTRNFAVEHEFTPVSFSAGLVWDFADGYNLGLSLSHSERAPSAAELLSFGPHIGTGSYEVGGLFSLHNDHGEAAHFGLTDHEIVMETANNIDLSLRKFKGDFGFILNAFYNQIDDYYYEQATGLSAGDGHDHSAHGHDDHGEEAHTLPLYLFTSQDVTLHGFEAQAVWQVTDEFSWKVQGDIIRARLDNGGELPRTPPARITTELSYEGEKISADLFVGQHFEQTHIAALETSTDSYTMVDANVNYHFTLGQHDLAVYLKGKNLTDEYAQVHTSFLKDLTPLAGRSIAVGIRGSF